MKYWIRWIIAAIVVGLLFLRMIYNHFNNLEEEKTWYLKQLHYDFSARVDSVLSPGRAWITVTGGEFDPHREWELRNDIKAHGILEVVIRSGKKLDLRIPYAARKGDSVYVNSDNDVLSLYRGDSLMVSRPLSVSLRGRPF